MRTTVWLDDNLLEQLKAQARKENVSLTRLLNRTLKAGLQAGGARRRKRPLYRERTHSLGAPRVTLGKALALTAVLEDEEIVRRLTRQK